MKRYKHVHKQKTAERKHRRSLALGKGKKGWVIYNGKINKSYMKT